MNTKTFAILGKFCSKFGPGLTVMPKSTKKVNPPVAFIILHGIDQTLPLILFFTGLFKTRYLLGGFHWIPIHFY